jgi:hypothetical protein
MSKPAAKMKQIIAIDESQAFEARRWSGLRSSVWAGLVIDAALKQLLSLF